VAVAGIPLARRGRTDSVGSRLECGNGSRLSVFIYRGGISLTRLQQYNNRYRSMQVVCIPLDGISMILYIIFSLNKNNLQSYILRCYQDLQGRQLQTAAKRSERRTADGVNPKVRRDLEKSDAENCFLDRD
jgi:hypothetical protein